MPAVLNNIVELSSGVARMLNARGIVDASSSVRRPRLRREDISAGGAFVVPATIAQRDESRAAYRNDVAVDVGVYSPLPAGVDAETEAAVIASVIDTAEAVAKATREFEPIDDSDPGVPLPYTFIQTEIEVLVDEVLEVQQIALSVVRVTYRLPRAFSVGV
jgi:hypothetical protein